MLYIGCLLFKILGEQTVLLILKYPLVTEADSYPKSLLSSLVNFN